MTSSVLEINETNRVEVVHQGAHLSSWLCDGVEQIFLSEQAVFAPGKAIRGGVPLIFPQFSEFGPGPRHGFVRTAEWILVSTTANRLVFSLSDTEKSRQLWPNAFSLRFSVCLEPSCLTLCLEVHNTDEKPWEFYAALHTYLRVMNVSKSYVAGLQGKKYWQDNGNSFADKHTESRDEFNLEAMMDRVYFDVDNELRLKEETQQRVITSQGFADVVIWNPWREGAEKLSDMADNEYQQMLCIEAAAVEKPVTLAPGERWTGEQKIRVL